VNRICAGKSRIVDFYIRGGYNTLVLTTPDFDTRLRADEIYDSVLCEAIGADLYSADQCVELARQYNRWDNEKESRLEKIPKDIEEMKVLIYQNFHKPAIVSGIRKNLRAAEETQNTLSCEKYSYDFLSSEYLARAIRYQYILENTLYYDSGVRVFSGDYWDDSTPDTIIANLISSINANMISDSQYRFLVQRDPWRSMWIAGKESTSLFGIPSSRLSDEQKAAISWSKLYDSVYEAYEKPTSAVISDDDALDGWMIHIGRKAAEDAKNRETSDFTNNSKIKDAGEVYILNNQPGEIASSLQDEDIKGIREMNSAKAKEIIKLRNKALSQRGEILEQDLPDVKAKFQQEIARQSINSIKNRGK
jgi:hypothetical protein